MTPAVRADHNSVAIRPAGRSISRSSNVTLSTSNMELNPWTLNASTLLEIQALAVIFALTGAATALARDPTDRFLRPIERMGSKLSQRRAVSCLALAALVLLIRIAIISIWSIPRPRIQDEFAYLLGGETFALGRLTNVSPKYWRFFEAPHILVTPSFQSKYPPGQAVALALGKVLLGHPWFGVMLSCAAMAAAICWMLQAWMPARWALLGGLLSLVRLAIYSYWMNSYWGGSVAAIGGCLVMGAYPRVVKRGQFGYAWAIGAGLFILANTRPLEGAISSLPIGIALTRWLIRASSRARLQVAAPIAVCLMLGVAFIGYYDFRVTGNPLDMPHREFARQYAHAPMLIVGKVDTRHITYSNVDVAYQYAIWESATVTGTKLHYWATRWYYAGIANHEALGLLLAAPLLLLPLTLRDHNIRLMLACLLMMLLMLLLDGSASLHYAAPQIGSFFGLLVQCIRHMRAGSDVRLRRAGRFLSRTLIVASVACFIGFGIALARSRGWQEPASPIQRRPEMEATLQGLSDGKALVFVRYRFDPRRIFPFEDWNYNSPDLFETPVLWVHDMGRSENEKILQEYPDRTPFYCMIDYSNGPDAEPHFSQYNNKPLPINVYHASPNGTGDSAKQTR